MSNAREEILDRIRKALVKPDTKPVAEPDMVSDLYTRPEEEDLALVFAEVFAEKAGQLIYVENYPEFYTEIAAFVAQRGYQHICCWEGELAQAHEGKADALVHGVGVGRAGALRLGGRVQGRQFHLGGGGGFGFGRSGFRRHQKRANGVLGLTQLFYFGAPGLRKNST